MLVIRPFDTHNQSIPMNSRMRSLVLQVWLAIVSSHTTMASWNNLHSRDDSHRYCRPHERIESLAKTAVSKQTFLPVGIATGQAPAFSTEVAGTFQLTPSKPIATLDYGSEVAGYPSFDVSSVSGRVQIEVKYAEAFQALSSNFSDGPYPFAVGLSNTYRVETFEVTTVGQFEAFLLQGGQRWQSIHLLTPGSIAFSSVGFKPSVPVVDIDSLPGQFECDNEKLNEIWKLGAKAATMSCLEQGTQRGIWQVNQTGAFIRGMRSGLSAEGAFLKDYTLEFDARIERGGIGWAVVK